MRRLHLSVLEETFAICRLDGRAQMPTWLPTNSLTSVTRTCDELSVVCPQGAVPEGIRQEGDWRCLRVTGPLEFDLVGVLASLTGPLAAAGISLFAISTFDTDYLLVRASDLARAVEVLERHGHTVG